MNGDVHADRDAVAVGIHQTDVHVVGLVRDRRARDEAHRRRRLVVHSRQPGAEDFECDRVEPRAAERGGAAQGAAGSLSSSGTAPLLARNSPRTSSTVRMSANSWIRTLSEGWCSMSLSVDVPSLSTTTRRSIIMPSRAVDSTQMLVFVPQRTIVSRPRLRSRRSRLDAPGTKHEYRFLITTKSESWTSISAKNC